MRKFTDKSTSLTTHLSQPVFLSKYARFAFKNLDVSYVRLERGVKPEHEHESVQVSVALSNQPMIAVKRKPFGAISKQLWLRGNSCVIPSWQRHTIIWEKPAEWISFHLAPSYLNRAAHDLGIKTPVEIASSFCRHDPIIEVLGRALGNALRDDSELLNLYVQSLAGTLVKHLLTNYAADKTTIRIANGGLAPPKLRRVLEFIEANLTQNITMDELAASVELSQFHFARAFKESTGFAPHQFIIRRRMENAKLLLIDKSVSIGEVARQVGYQSHSRFSSLFQKHTALTPRKFREWF